MLAYTTIPKTSGKVSVHILKTISSVRVSVLLHCGEVETTTPTTSDVAIAYSEVISSGRETLKIVRG